MAMKKTKTPLRAAAPKPRAAKQPAARKAASRKPAKRAAPVAKPTAHARQQHRWVLEYDWDDGIEPLRELVEDPATDRGTVLAIYWLGAAGWYRRYATPRSVPVHERKHHEMIRAIEAHYANGHYARASLLFNPRFDRTTVSDTGYDWTAEYADVAVKHEIPALMLEPSIPDPAWEARGRVPPKLEPGRLQ